MSYPKYEVVVRKADGTRYKITVIGKFNYGNVFTYDTSVEICLPGKRTFNDLISISILHNVWNAKNREANKLGVYKSHRLLSDIKSAQLEVWHLLKPQCDWDNIKSIPLPQ